MTADASLACLIPAPTAEAPAILDSVCVRPNNVVSCVILLKKAQGVMASWWFREYALEGIWGIVPAPSLVSLTCDGLVPKIAF